MKEATSGVEFYVRNLTACSASCRNETPSKFNRDYVIIFRVKKNNVYTIENRSKKTCLVREE